MVITSKLLLKLLNMWLQIPVSSLVLTSLLLRMCWFTFLMIH